jgi:signal transduction histidine kinase
MNEDARKVIALVQRSAARMAGLIENVMDFARGRLGGGLSLVRRDEGLGPILDQVISEARASWPGRVIQSEIVLSRSVACDSARIAQMFSNLLANALTHGDPNGPIRVRAHSDDTGFELFVANLGQPIPPDIADRLFQPFSRASAAPGHEGLGLGLYIASEIARAHEGSLEVSSSVEETRFTFRMPLPVALIDADLEKPSNPIANGSVRANRASP